MQGLIITPKGAEEIAAEEVKALGGDAVKKNQGCVTFSVKNEKDLARITYRSQSAERTLLFLHHIKFKDLEDLCGKIKLEGVEQWVQKGSKVRVLSQRRGEHDFTHVDVEHELGKIVLRYLKEKGREPKVDLHAADVSFYAFVVDNICFFGIDFTGFDSSKRDYKLFMTPTSIKGNVAFTLLKFSGYKKGDVLVDPFAGDGTILVEAALSGSHKSPHYYRKDHFAFRKLLCDEDAEKLFENEDKNIKKSKGINGFDAAFKHVDCARKNAKIAGVEKMIKLSRVEAEWLDLKFKEASVDKLITKLPEQSKRFSENNIRRLHNEFFYQAEYILKKDGRVGILVRSFDSIKEIAAKHKFKIEKKQDLWMGNQKMEVAVLKNH